MIDRLIRLIGNAVAWLVVFMVAGTLYNVVARYVFGDFSIPLGEIIIIMNSMVFLLAAPLLLQRDQHVRVDVFYAGFSEKKKALVDVFGGIFLLLPLCGYIMYFSWGYVSASWQRLESSSQTGGLPGLYLVKSLIIAVAVLLVLQGIAIIARKLVSIVKAPVITFDECKGGKQL